MAIPKHLSKIAILISALFLLGISAYLMIRVRTQNSLIESLTVQLKNETEYPPPVTSNEDPNGERSHFTFSPDKKYIAFIQDVFEEFGEDFDRYWALKIFNPATREERSLLVDDSKLSGYDWLDAETLRVFHSAGTDVRVFKDIRVGEAPLFSRDYKYTAKHSTFWTPDEAYVTELVDAQKAREVYYEKLSPN